MDTRTHTMTIGELSARTAVPVKALREYTDLGLIYTLGRSPAGYRLYTDDALWCVRFIGELRGLGLTIAEIHHLVTAGGDTSDRSVVSHLAELLHRSRQRLHERISHAQQILDRIDEFETTQRACGRRRPVFGGRSLRMRPAGLTLTPGTDPTVNATHQASGVHGRTRCGPGRFPRTRPARGPNQIRTPDS